MCCEPSGYTLEEINGECSDCENPTVDGEAYEQCGYSPVECNTCNWRLCNQSC